MIPLIKSTFYHEKETKKKLCSFINHSSILSFSEHCQLFEKKFATWQERKDSVMVNSGSSANLALLQALLNTGKLKPGARVGFSAVTWSTNVMPIIQLGLKPIPIDVELDTLNISSETLRRAIRKNPIDCLFLTNLLGFCSDIDVIASVCKKEHIIFIEDNCESLGTVYKGKKLGNYSYASTFSFYVGHHMSTIEGGAVVTDDVTFATALRLVRAHGWDRNLSTKNQELIRKKYRINSTFYSRYTFYDLGYNLRPTEINGYIGQLQLPYLDEIIRKRQENYFHMVSKIYKRTDRYFPVRHTHIELLSNFAVPIICRSQKIRDELVKRCASVVEIRPIVGGDMTNQPFFSKYSTGKMYNCPQARLIHENGLYFANNPQLTKQEMDRITKIFVTIP